MESQQTLGAVQDYYGRVLSSNKDLKTSACCLPEAVPPYQKAYLSRIHSEVLEKFYGCGSPIPLAIEGKNILDLGCGTGRDVFLLAALAGRGSTVIGVDMTEEQLGVARKHTDHHIKEFNLQRGAIQFKKGYIEDLKTMNIPDNSIDVVVSNCVINLSPDKEKVFKEIFRVLRPGGELFFSDIFTQRRLEKDLCDDPVLVGECLGGALYIEDFRRLLADLGFRDFRQMAASTISLSDPVIEKRIGHIPFLSITYRVFKLDLEDRCEDYGQVAVYRGGIPHAEESFTLDDHHQFERGKPMLVCGNTADMLSKTRFSSYFSVTGDRSRHFGLFDCGPVSGASNIEDLKTSGACC